MAKITVEIDTDTQTSSLKIDGEDANIEEFSVGRYVNGPCCGKDSSSQGEPYTYISFTKVDGNNRYSTSISFQGQNKSEQYSYTIDNYSMAREIGKVHKNQVTAHKLAKSLGKKMPMATIDCSNDKKYMTSTDPHMNNNAPDTSTDDE